MTAARGEDAGNSTDVDAYDLILRDKETLLSFPDPKDDADTRLRIHVRFIFSHSALREGWDNPNVFVICTLKHSDSTISRRQEVGRGTIPSKGTTTQKSKPSRKRRRTSPRRSRRRTTSTTTSSPTPRWSASSPRSWTPAPRSRFTPSCRAASPSPLRWATTTRTGPSHSTPARFATSTSSPRPRAACPRSNSARSRPPASTAPKSSSPRSLPTKSNTMWSAVMRS